MVNNLYAVIKINYSRNTQKTYKTKSLINYIVIKYIPLGNIILNSNEITQVNIEKCNK